MSAATTINLLYNASIMITITAKCCMQKCAVENVQMRQLSGVKRVLMHNISAVAVIVALCLLQLCNKIVMIIS